MKIKRFDYFYRIINEDYREHIWNNLKEYQTDLKIEEIEILDEILNMPLTARRELKDTLKSIPKKGNLNENVFTDLFDKFKSWLNKKAIDWLINHNEKEISKRIDLLNLVDPTDFTNIKSVEGIYLGGGIDKTKPDSEVKFWREETEQFFGESHIVQGEDIIKLGKTGEIDKSKFPKPMILNPMRNELVRFKGDFKKALDTWKSGGFNEMDPGSSEEDLWKYWAKTANTTMTNPDRRIIMQCDTNLISTNAGAGMGTWGEAELTAYANMNMFVWLNDGWSIKDISPWLVPSVTKIVRNKEEYNLLLTSIKVFNGDYSSGIPMGYKGKNAKM